MDEKETMLIILKAIHVYCLNNVDCTGCPFYLSGKLSFGNYCMFAGLNFDECINPEEWDISELERTVREDGR